MSLEILSPARIYYQNRSIIEQKTLEHYKAIRERLEEALSLYEEEQGLVENGVKNPEEIYAGIFPLEIHGESFKSVTEMHEAMESCKKYLDMLHEMFGKKIENVLK